VLGTLFGLEEVDAFSESTSSRWPRALVVGQLPRLSPEAAIDQIRSAQLCVR
jgi:hypothetical protein